MPKLITKRRRMPRAGKWIELLALVACASAVASTAAAQSQPDSGVLRLDGRGLTVAQVWQVADGNRAVSIAPEALTRMQRSFDLLIAAAEQGIAVYGLNHGVGANKDKTIFTGAFTADEQKKSEEFNANNLRATSAGAGTDAAESAVRAAMVVRLNTMLLGYSGARPRVAEMYRELLNRRIHPVVPTRASVGEADITILAHIGLAMMGEGEVHYQGARMPAAQALRAAGITLLVPVAKDSLAIMSSNAYAAGTAALAAHEARRLLEVAPRVFALSLEGLNGNVAPFLPEVLALRPYSEPAATARSVLAALEGSYLWRTSPARALQDPLSFRGAAHVIGVAVGQLEYLNQRLEIQMNSSDDNPAVLLDAEPAVGAPPQVLQYYVQTGNTRGAVIPTANFEPTPWVLQLQALSVALAQVSQSTAARITRLGSPAFTGLTRFLAPNDITLAYSAIQKVYASLDAEIAALSDPVSDQTMSLANDIEDVGTNSVDATSRLRRIIDDLYSEIGIELMHAAQAVDLRRIATPGLPLGRGTGELLKAFRGVVTFLTHDRHLTPDVVASARFLRTVPLP
jgi:histidine ammonia-lyase